MLSKRLEFLKNEKRFKSLTITYIVKWKPSPKSQFFFEVVLSWSVTFVIKIQKWKEFLKKKCNIIHEDIKPDKSLDNFSSTYPPSRLQQPISSLYLINLNITWFWSRTCSSAINPGYPPNHYPQPNYNMEILLLLEKFMPGRKYVWYYREKGPRHSCFWFTTE